MAEKEDKDLDLDVEQGKSKTNLLIIILIVVVLAVGGGVAALFLLSGDDSEGDKDSAKSENATPVKANAIYANLRPTFIINFQDTRKARYVQIDLSALTRKQSVVDLLTEHSPVIRNNIITILSSQTYEELNTRAGKEKLRAELLDSINQTIEAELTNTPPKAEDSDNAAPAALPPGTKYVEEVYFTSLVMQ